MGEQLITLVRDNPALYDKSRRDYIDSELKDNIWARIAAELGRDAKQVQGQWKNLCDTYRKSKKERQGTSGQAAGPKKKPWKYMEAMSFIDKTTQFRRVSSNITEEGQTGNEEEEEEAEVELVEMEEDVEEANPNPKRQRRATPASDKSFVEDYLRRKEERQQQREEDKDDTCHFLLSLAPAMRRLNQESQSTVRMKFQQVLHEEQFGQRAQTYTPQQAHHSGDPGFMTTTYMNLH